MHGVPSVGAARRARLAPPLVGVVALLLALVACGSPEPTPGAGDADPSGAYPVTITHQFGSTTIPSAPQRVVAVGFNEADFVLALGVVPVGVRDYVGEFDEDARPWAQEQLGGAAPEKVGGTTLDFERIAALRPDLILGVYSYMEQADYDTLSKIAPTVAQPGPETATWQEQTLVTGQALAKEDEARRLVADVEARFADAAAAHPAFAGKSVAVVLSGRDESGSLYALEGDDLRARFFTDLGLVYTERTGEISQESYGVADKDLLVVLGADSTTYADDPLFQNLGAVREQRTFYSGGYDSEFSGALGFGSPLSLPYALDIAVPRLAAATDGDPTNSTD